MPRTGTRFFGGTGRTEAGLPGKVTEAVARPAMNAGEAMSTGMQYADTSLLD
ncbi:hypothetical protein [Stigmatella aurantiaca]|uniref:hypothetical protein n=1 Tax=Stigmatella aurantiaca TaxID=41 RepID=UPI0015A51379|nr:hypothetical protein [Stigmatella aurantiaca]